MKISALPFYGILTASEHNMLAQNVSGFSCEKGQILHEAGEGSYGMIYVEEGTLSVSLLSEDGREVTLFLLRKGEVCFLSASESLQGISFDITVTAEDPSKILTTSQSFLSLLMKNNTVFSQFVYGTVTKNFSDTVKLLQSVLFDTFDRRLAVFLYEEMTKTKTTVLSLTHEQIARHIGSAREVVTRTLKRFSGEGIVVVGRGTLTITSREKLKKKMN